MRMTGAPGSEFNRPHDAHLSPSPPQLSCERKNLKIVFPRTGIVLRFSPSRGCTRVRILACMASRKIYVIGVPNPFEPALSFEQIKNTMKEVKYLLRFYSLFGFKGLLLSRQKRAIPHRGLAYTE
jgi:hypothetical protein